jgi:TetR/AcrR family transcriptional regulator
MTIETTSRRSHTTRQRILGAASKEFADQGFAGARVDEIARSADVNKAMLYYHVGNKQDLYTAVLTRNFDRMDEALVDATAAEGSGPDRLQAIIAGVAQALKANPDHSRIVLREFASGGANLQPEVLQRLVKILGMVRTLLADGVRSEEFRATDPVMTHLTLVGASLILNAVTPLVGRVSEIDPEIRFPGDDADVGIFLADLLLNGISAPRTGEAS